MWISRTKSKEIKILIEELKISRGGPIFQTHVQNSDEQKINPMQKPVDSYSSTCLLQSTSTRGQLVKWRTYVIFFVCRSKKRPNVDYHRYICLMFCTQTPCKDDDDVMAWLLFVFAANMFVINIRHCSRSVYVEFKWNFSTFLKNGFDDIFDEIQRNTKFF